MPENRLQMADIRPGVQHERCGRMAKQMAGSRLGEARSVHHAAHLAGDLIRMQRTTPFADKELAL